LTPAGSGSGGSPDGGSGTGGDGGVLPTGQARVAVQPTGTGAGRVTSNTGGLDCPGTCSVIVASGTAITLTATPDGHSNFLGWGGACSGSTCNLTANGDQTAWANFEAKKQPPVSTC